MLARSLANCADRSFAAEVASADIPVTVIPSQVAAYHLWRLRTWSLPLTLFVSGGYVQDMLLLLADPQSGNNTDR